jgi:hypothetical protein
MSAALRTPSFLAASARFRCPADSAHSISALVCPEAGVGGVVTTPGWSKSAHTSTGLERVPDPSPRHATLAHPTIPRCNLDRDRDRLPEAQPR